MPTDEFGRQVPLSSTTFSGLAGSEGAPGYVNNATGRSRRPNSPSPPSSGPAPLATTTTTTSELHHPNHHHHQRHLQQHQQSHYGNNSRYGGGNYRHRSDRGSGGGGYHHSSHHQSYGGGRNHYLSAPVSSLVPTPTSIKSESTTGHGGLIGKAGTEVMSNPLLLQPSPQTQPNDHYQQYRSHPSFTYVDVPLLCGFVWKSSEMAPKPEELLKIKKESGSVQEDENDRPDNPDAEHNENENDPHLMKLYDEYRKRYCLNYIRSFFNVHLDDSWFRQRYSPSVRKQAIHLAEYNRAVTEAQNFIPKSLSIGDFLNEVRLGSGIKQQQAAQQQSTSLVPSGGTAALGVRKPGPSVTTIPTGAINAAPVQHLFSFQQKLPHPPIDGSESNNKSRDITTFGLHILDIPSYVTDEHVALGLVEQYNTVAMAKHEQKIAELQKSSAKSEGGASNPNNADVSKDKSSNPTAMANVSVPKKGAKLQSSVSLPPPTLLKVNELKIYPAPATLVSDGPPSVVMHRQVFATGPVDAFLEIVVSLKQRLEAKANASLDATTPSGGAANGTKRSIPRKIGGGIIEQSIYTHPEAFYGPFDLDVDCSDPYGRMEYDADGRGGAPADGQTVPQRRAVVGVSPVYTAVSSQTDNSSSTSHHSNIDLATANLRKQQHGSYTNTQQQHPFATPIVVLSAALSSKTRIEQDFSSASTIAKALDVKKRIPHGFRLQDVLSNEIFDSTSTEDKLDISIAYLRRVHLMSYYTGCSEPAETIGDVLAGKHYSSAIHLRLQNADEFIQNNKANDESKEDESADNVDDAADTSVPKESGEPMKDLLVQRLDDSISKALESVQKWLDDDVDNDSIPEIIDEQMERDSKDIGVLEEQVQKKWVDDHCIDDDGRARCAFRFCHKLFKDKSFLEKHLLKKHCEFLRAEQAKCHDQFMMQEWDPCLSRPVPPVLVDCGTRFGCVSAAIITGQSEPDVVDPEPELWNRHQEQQRRELEMKQKREELRQQQQQQMNSHQNYVHKERNAETPRQDGKRNRSFFVDVDDMKEEKVEVSFDAIEADAAALLAAANKKKKKKKKLL